ncbi:MAG: hypothetical protein JSS07_02710 [Proteobacteria bacterium]|nr:hypothetical protein [Pseudomonadota bacterium]
MRELEQQSLQQISGGNVISFLTSMILSDSNYSFHTAIVAGTLVGLACTLPSSLISLANYPITSSSLLLSASSRTFAQYTLSHALSAFTASIAGATLANFVPQK